MSHPTNLRDALAEDVEWMLHNGEGISQILTRLGRTPTAIARALYRAGRGDLATPFNRLVLQAKRHPCHDCGRPGVNRNADRCARCAAIVREAKKRAS